MDKNFRKMATVVKQPTSVTYRVALFLRLINKPALKSINCRGSIELRKNILVSF